MWDAFYHRYGSGTGGIICMQVVTVAIFFCGMSSLASCSRMNYAFARDGAMPGSFLWKQSHPKTGVPVNAVWLSVVVAFLMGLPVREGALLGKSRKGLSDTNFPPVFPHTLCSSWAAPWPSLLLPPYPPSGCTLRMASRFS